MKNVLFSISLNVWQFLIYFYLYLGFNVEEPYFIGPVGHVIPESGRFGFSRSTPLIARQHPLTRHYRLATDAVSRFNGCPALKTRNSNFFFTSLLLLYTPLLPRWRGGGVQGKAGRGKLKLFLKNCIGIEP